MKFRLTAILLIAFASDALPQAAILRDAAIVHPVVGYGGIVSTQDAHATMAAADVLAEGGNAIDAAVTAGFTLAVTLPRAGNIGGGGFMIVHLADEKKQIAIDYREKAPKAATRDMFLDGKGNPIADLSRITHLAAGVPGTVRGLALALEKHGTISLKRALAPAIELAENGFFVSEDLSDSLKTYADKFKASPAHAEAVKIFYYDDGKPPAVGTRLLQEDLAKTLRLISEQGPDAFYKGAIADAIIADMKANGGLITKDDLASYQPVLRQPVTGTYRGLKVVSMPPPSSGGVHLIQMLNILEHFPIGEFGHNSAAAIHAHAPRRCVSPTPTARSYLGDPDFWPTCRLPAAHRQGLRSKNCAATIDLRTRATPESEEIKHRRPRPAGAVREPGDHPLLASWIAGATPCLQHLHPQLRLRQQASSSAGTGILLNNEMDDFSAKPGVPNAYGLIGGRSNAIEPEKRMLSSMTPTLLFKEDGSVIATGSPGGSRIINIVLQLTCNLADHGMNLAEATTAPRFHHQWFPDELRIERGFSPDTIKLLEARGHKVRLGAAMGSTQTVAFGKGRFQGASDPRRRGALTIGLPMSPAKAE